MKNLSNLLLVPFMLVSITMSYSQSEEVKTEGNSSKETVTKTIRIKGANGEEKVIKKEEVITKKSKLKLNPNDENKTNQSVEYTDEEVAVQKSHSSTDIKTYTKTTDDKGFIMNLSSKSDNKTAKARALANGYYIVNFGNDDNCLGHFDDDKNFILEKYDSKMDQIMTTVYKAN
ncbi:hypothetical protein [Aquimarina longa]|uniref:hypothetical protein n=1 Tax=Aquimarina longa TaxID=1080221 RepID=UPI000780AC47|nr:hypothetical protein [Aquimarina longa]